MPIAFHMGSNGSIWVNRRAAQPEDQCALGQSSQELPFSDLPEQQWWRYSDFKAGLLN